MPIEFPPFLSHTIAKNSSSKSNFETNPSTKSRNTYYVDVTLGHLKENELNGFSVFTFDATFLNVGFVLLLLHDWEAEKRFNLMAGNWEAEEKRSGSAEGVDLGGRT